MLKAGADNVTVTCTLTRKSNTGKSESKVIKVTIIAPIPPCTGGMVFNKCGSSSVKTCEKQNPIATKQCVRKC